MLTPAYLLPYMPLSYGQICRAIVICNLQTKVVKPAWQNSEYHGLVLEAPLFTFETFALASLVTFDDTDLLKRSLGSENFCSSAVNFTGTCLTL